MNLAEAKNEDEKAPIEKRIAKLTGGIAVIQVGAATETEMKEKLDRFDDSVRAVKAAISEGYVVGGGTAFIRICPKSISVGESEINLIKNGVSKATIPYSPESVNSLNFILFDVLKEPLRQICRNAGVDDENILSQVRKETGDVGYNAKTGNIEDLVESGIIDPVKVLRCALQNAASSATMILTSEVLIADTL